MAFKKGQIVFSQHQFYDDLYFFAVICDGKRPSGGRRNVRFLGDYNNIIAKKVIALPLRLQKLQKLPFAKFPVSGFSKNEIERLEEKVLKDQNTAIEKIMVFYIFIINECMLCIQAIILFFRTISIKALIQVIYKMTWLKKTSII